MPPLLEERAGGVVQLLFVMNPRSEDSSQKNLQPLSEPVRYRRDSKTYCRMAVKLTF